MWRVQNCLGLTVVPSPVSDPGGGGRRLGSPGEPLTAARVLSSERSKGGAHSTGHDADFVYVCNQNTNHSLFLLRVGVAAVERQSDPLRAGHSLGHFLPAFGAAENRVRSGSL